MPTESSLIEYTETGPSTTVCTVIEYPPGSQSFTRESLGSDVRSALIKGDRFHALPYWRRVVEPLTADGILFYSAASKSFSVPCHRPSARCSGIIPIIAWGEAVPVEPTLARDRELESYLRGIAETKALADARRSFNNLPLLIVERRQTLQMILTRSRHLLRGATVAQREALQRWYRSRRKDRAMVARDIANHHLELLFGWLPLIGEIEGLCDQLAEPTTTFITGRGRMADVSLESYPPSLNRVNVLITPSNENYAWASLRGHLERRVSVRTSLKYKIDIGATQKLRDNGFNPLATAYDLIPLSFVAAFVSNVDHFLKAHDPMLGASYETGSSGLWIEERSYTDVTGAFRQDDTWTYKTSGGGRVEKRGIFTQRWVLPQPPTPELFWVNRMTPGRAATAIALVIQKYLKPLKVALKVKEFRYRGPRPRYLPPIQYRR